MAEHNATLSEARVAWRNALAAKPVTLNGQQATIGGVRKPFAVVTQLGTGLSAEWSWEAVERIVNRGGAFVS